MLSLFLYVCTPVVEKRVISSRKNVALFTAARVQGYPSRRDCSRPSRDVDVLAPSVAAPFVRGQGCHKTDLSLSQISRTQHRHRSRILQRIAVAPGTYTLDVKLILTLLAFKTSRTSLTCSTMTTPTTLRTTFTVSAVPLVPDVRVPPSLCSLLTVSYLPLLLRSESLY